VTADHTVLTVERARLSVVAFDHISALFCAHPRLGIALCWQLAQEQAVAAEHLVNLGRRDAYTRLGHLIVELYWRLDAVGLVQDEAYHCTLTQALLADTLGLSLVYLNRTLQRLREAGLVQWHHDHNGQVRLLNRRVFE
jgi:CRP-like cAMP-binding protein